jgi:hypothetical protein
LSGLAKRWQAGLSLNAEGKTKKRNLESKNAGKEKDEGVRGRVDY